MPGFWGLAPFATKWRKGAAGLIGQNNCDFMWQYNYNEK